MPGIEWTGVKFSGDGKCILLSTNANQIILIDAFSGNELHRLTVSAVCVCVCSCGVWSEEGCKRDSVRRRGK